MSCRVFQLVWVLLAAMPAGAQEKPRSVHVIVALCDNRTQGIAPVPAKIGDGDDPDHNLYWGCSDGLREQFRHGGRWRLVSKKSSPRDGILERCVFEHKETRAILVADAYRGSRIKDAIADFYAVLAGGFKEAPAEAADPDLVAYIGHDGLMDFEVAVPRRAEGARRREAVVLCCRSSAWFSEPLKELEAAPRVLTTQLMYPGSFILEGVLEGWFRGEDNAKLLDRAAQAYAKNQRISAKAARGVFTAPGRGRSDGGKG